MRHLLLLPAFCLALCISAQELQRVQVYGTVTDSLTGRAVYTTIEHYDLAGKRWSLTEVNAEGRYALFVPAGEAFELRVAPLPGQQELRHTVPAVDPATRTLRLNLRLQPALPDAER